jgi:GTPase
MIEKRVIKQGDVPERAILVGVTTQLQSDLKTQEYLNELEFLALTAGAIVIKRFTQKMEKPDSKLFVGSGKAQQIAIYAYENNIDCILFDDDLTPSQQKNFERELEEQAKLKAIYNAKMEGKEAPRADKEFSVNIKVVDRTRLILDIFAQRARTAYAQTQVQLAQYQYLLPRLSRMWSHLDRIKGGIGMKGAGEKEIETDRRIVRDKISLLKDRLLEIDKQMVTQRKNRGDVIRVSLVGYTNVGKSTLMNTLSKSEVFAENKLFATLDTTVRKVVIGNLPFLLSDTVGFIRKLPHNLIESFKSTLDEVRESDILIHVVDVSHPNFQDHIDVVTQTIKDLGAADKPVLLVFNKIDAFTFVPQEEFELAPKEWNNYTLAEIKQHYVSASNNTDCLFVSATNKENLEELKDLLFDRVKALHTKRFPYPASFERF